MDERDVLRAENARLKQNVPPPGWIVTKQADIDRLHNESEALRIERNDARAEAERLRKEVHEARGEYSDFLVNLTFALNAKGVPATPSWQSAIDYLAAHGGIYAEGVAEGRAAMLCEVVALVRDPQRTWIVGRAERDLVADVIEDALGRFSSEGTT